MMDYQSEKVTLDDIVFESRNKSYGGYVLRKIYDDHILIALLIAATTFGLAIGGPAIFNALKPEEEVPEVKEVKLDLAKLPPPPPTNPKLPPPPPMPKVEPPPAVKTIKFTPPEVAPDEEVVEPPPKVDEVKKAAISNVTNEGAPDAPVVENIEVVGTGGEGTGVVAPPAEEIFVVVEQMPETPYNINEYLVKNIKYPQNAIRNEITGVVYVQFVVGPNGQVGDVKVVKGIGYGCDEEAVRVVSRMPAWNPGKQGGRAVPVRISLPVRFKLN